MFYVNNTYSTGGQTCLSLPLWIGATPDQSVSSRTELPGPFYIMMMMMMIGRRETGIMADWCPFLRLS